MIRSKSLRALIKMSEFSEFLEHVAETYQRYYGTNHTFNLNNIRNYEQIALRKRMRENGIYFDIFDIVIQTFYLKNECSLTHTRNPNQMDFEYDGKTPPSITTEDIKRVFDKDFIRERVYTTLVKISNSNKFHAAHNIAENFNSKKYISIHSYYGGNCLYHLISETKKTCKQFVKDNVFQEESKVGLPTKYALK